MLLYTSLRAPNPRRVHMFLAEKGIDNLERVPVDLNAGEHRSAATWPKARWPKCLPCS